MNVGDLGFEAWGLGWKVWVLHSRKLTWKPKKGPRKTTVLLKGGYMGFHASLGECRFQGLNSMVKNVLVAFGIFLCDDSYLNSQKGG